jgi:uncharacterized membrane protein
MEAKPSKKKPLSKQVVKDNQGIKITKSCKIAHSAADLYEFWRRLENLPLVMRHVESVKETSDVESHWVVNFDGKKRLEWDAIIFNEHPNELIAWRTKQGSPITHAGSVRFEADPDNAAETLLKVSLEYVPPSGKLIAWLNKLIGKDPGTRLEEDLKRFKTFVEIGEIDIASKVS